MANEIPGDCRAYCHRRGRHHLRYPAPGPSPSRRAQRGVDAALMVERPTRALFMMAQPFLILAVAEAEG